MNGVPLVSSLPVYSQSTQKNVIEKCMLESPAML